MQCRDASEYICERCAAIDELDNIEKILTARHAKVDRTKDGKKGSGQALEYHVKRADYSYLHTKWVPEDAMHEAAKVSPLCRMRLDACDGSCVSDE